MSESLSENTSPIAGDESLILNAQQVIELASKYWSEGKLEDVEKLADKLLAWRDDHEQAWFFKAMVAHARGELDDALVFLERTEAATELTVSRLLLGGRCQAGRGDIEAALLKFRQVLEFQPDNAEGYYWVGMCMREKVDLTEARSFLRRATLLDPGLAPAWYEQANVALVTERFDEAIRAYGKAAALIPNSHEVRNNLGLALRGKGDLAAAESAYKEAIALFPDYAEAYFNLAQVLNELGRNDEAVAAEQQALKLNPALAATLGSA